ncbi:hypothetical protein [Pararhizobium sp. O133]|uniref:hypothetical protein n=1 Tax=Pararhizobium sp. O133 TaxID=3449278 RepID=UPI003F683DA4
MAGNLSFSWILSTGILSAFTAAAKTRFRTAAFPAKTGHIRSLRIIASDDPTAAERLIFISLINDLVSPVESFRENPSHVLHA